MHDEDLQKRQEDFRRRADFAPHNVYVHCQRGFRYIPVHDFADDKNGASACVDAWCEFPTDVALVESITVDASKKKGGIQIRRDTGSPHFLKIQVVLAESAVTRAVFEHVLEKIADHPWSADGFRAAVPGSDLTLLPAP